MTYEDFYDQLKIYQKWNKGNGYDAIVRKIYIKYVYSGSNQKDDLEILYDNVIAMIEEAQSENELQEAENIVNTLKTDGQIEESEYNYFMNLIQDKRNNIQ